MPISSPTAPHEANESNIGPQASFQQRHCYPFIYYPHTGLQEANPAWATCIVAQRSPVFDPPRTLGPATALGPVQTSASSNPESTAAPASLAGPLVPSKTAPLSQPPPATWSGNDPPANNIPVPNDPPATDPPPPNDPPANDTPPPNDPPATDPPAPNKVGPASSGNAPQANQQPGQ